MTLELLEAVAETPTPIKPRRPKAAKTPAPKAVVREKVTLCLGSDANLRLTVHAAAMGLDRSSLVERLINEHLRRFVLQDRGDRCSTQEVSAA